MDTGTLAAILLHTRESPEQRRARILDEEITRLQNLRDEIDPNYAPPNIPGEKPQGWFGRMCSRIAFCIDVCGVMFWTCLGLFAAGIFLWYILETVIEHLF